MDVQRLVTLRHLPELIVLTENEEASRSNKERNSVHAYKDGLDYAVKEYPQYANRIEDLATDPDFQELCEHLAFVAHTENKAGSDEQMLRFTVLRGKLEEELLTWLGNQTN